jgi:hypothetical protein
MTRHVKVLAYPTNNYRRAKGKKVNAVNGAMCKKRKTRIQAKKKDGGKSIYKKHRLQMGPYIVELEVILIK